MSAVIHTDAGEIGSLQVVDINKARISLSDDTELTIFIPTFAEWPDGIIRSLPQSGVDQLIHYVLQTLSQTRDEAIDVLDIDDLDFASYEDPDPCPAGSEVIKDAVREWYSHATTESIKGDQGVLQSEIDAGYKMPEAFQGYSFVPSTGMSGFSYKAFKASNDLNPSFPVSLIHNEDENTPKMKAAFVGHRDPISGHCLISVHPSVELNKHCSRELTVTEHQSLKSYLQAYVEEKLGSKNPELSQDLESLVLDGMVSTRLQDTLKAGAADWLKHSEYTCQHFLGLDERERASPDDSILDLPVLEKLRDFFQDEPMKAAEIGATQGLSQISDQQKPTGEATGNEGKRTSL